MFEVLIMLVMHYAADLSLLLAVAALVTLVVTAYVGGLVLEFADESRLRPCFRAAPSPRCAIRWADPDAPGRPRPRAPGRSNLTAGTAA